MTDTHSKIADLLAETAKSFADADGAPVSPVYVFAAANELVLLVGRERDQMMMQPAPPASLAIPAPPAVIEEQPVPEVAPEPPTPPAEPGVPVVSEPIEAASAGGDDPK